MKKLLILSFALIASVAANAAYVNWATINTEAATGDTSAGGNSANYQAYVMAADQAEALFDGTSLKTICSYIEANYDTIVDEVKAASTTLSYDGMVGDQYSFYTSAKDAFSADSVAVLFYDNGSGSDWKQYRVFSADAVEFVTDGVAQGAVLFDDASTTVAAGSSSTWAVPEPTSGLLLLVGGALLALRRKSR